MCSHLCYARPVDTEQARLHRDFLDRKLDREDFWNAFEENNHRYTPTHLYLQQNHTKEDSQASQNAKNKKLPPGEKWLTNERLKAEIEALAKGEPMLAEPAAIPREVAVRKFSATTGMPIAQPRDGMRFVQRCHINPGRYEPVDVVQVPADDAAGRFPGVVDLKAIGPAEVQQGTGREFSQWIRSWFTRT